MPDVPQRAMNLLVGSRLVPLALPIGDVMQRISLAWFSELGAALAPVANGQTMTSMTVFDLHRVRNYLNVLATEANYPLDLKASRPVVNQLLWHINNVLNVGDLQKQNENLETGRWQIWMDASRLETLLNGELAVQPVYHIWPIRAYNTEVLVVAGERVFSEDARKEFNEQEIYNLKEAGKCLAFQIPTAAAFHMFRCVESLIRRYYELVVGNLPKPKMRNWGAYIRNLKECGANQKVTTILEQIKDLHRNPVIHPEEQLNNEEAFSLVGILDSAVTAIIADMKVRREKTSPSLPFLAVAQEPTSPDFAAYGVPADEGEKKSA